MLSSEALGSMRVFVESSRRHGGSSLDSSSSNSSTDAEEGGAGDEDVDALLRVDAATTRLVLVDAQWKPERPHDESGHTTLAIDVEFLQASSSSSSSSSSSHTRSTADNPLSEGGEEQADHTFVPTQSVWSFERQVVLTQPTVVDSQQQARAAGDQESAEWTVAAIAHRAPLASYR